MLSIKHEKTKEARHCGMALDMKNTGPDGNHGGHLLISPVAPNYNQPADKARETPVNAAVTVTSSWLFIVQPSSPRPGRLACVVASSARRSIKIKARAYYRLAAGGAQPKELQVCAGSYGHQRAGCIFLSPPQLIVPPGMRCRERRIDPRVGFHSGGAFLSFSLDRVEDARSVS